MSYYAEYRYGLISKDELIADIAGQKGAFGGRILNYLFYL